MSYAYFFISGQNMAEIFKFFFVELLSGHPIYTPARNTIDYNFLLSAKDILSASDFAFDERSLDDLCYAYWIKYLKILA